MPRSGAYLDECVNVYLETRLRVRGFFVTTARDAGMAGASDAEQLTYATPLRSLLVSYDSLDYRRLHRISGAHHGIILLRNTNLDWQELRAAMLLDWVATLPDYRGQLFRWHDLQHLLIGGMRLPGYGVDDVRRALGQESSADDSPTFSFPRSSSRRAPITSPPTAPPGR